MGKAKKFESALKFRKPDSLRKDADFVDTIKGERYNFQKRTDGTYEITHAVSNNKGWCYISQKNEKGEWKIISAPPQDASLEALFASKVMRHELRSQMKKDKS